MRRRGRGRSSRSARRSGRGAEAAGSRRVPRFRPVRTRRGSCRGSRAPAGRNADRGAYSSTSSAEVVPLGEPITGFVRRAGDRDLVDQRIGNRLGHRLDVEGRERFAAGVRDLGQAVVLEDRAIDRDREVEADLPLGVADRLFAVGCSDVRTYGTRRQAPLARPASSSAARSDGRRHFAVPAAGGDRMAHQRVGDAPAARIMYRLTPATQIGRSRRAAPGRL